MTLDVVSARICPSCGEAAGADANWCEACGADLTAVAAKAKGPCVACGARPAEVTDDGWCQICGRKQPAEGDHVVADHGWFAVVSDRGRAHRVNEDAGAVAARPAGVAMVVCDGVSSTDQSQNAAQAATATVIERIAGAPAARVAEALIDAAHQAQAAIVAISGPVVKAPPSCTMVAAVADVIGARAELRVGWLGDSRAYWLVQGDGEHEGTVTQLSRDHSWATEQLDLGELDAATIDADARAHSITRWLGADSHETTPERVSGSVDLPGVLLLCSDGLWNYTPTESELYDLVFEVDDEPPLVRAERLVAFANARGGHDNITVAIADLTPRTEPSPPLATSEQTQGSDHG